MNRNNYTKPNIFIYRFVQLVAFVFAMLVFHRKMLRNELRGVQGPFVVIANHQAAYDFVNLIGASSRPMSFVLSNSFYNSLPIQGILNGIGVIPKQQFQTSLSDMKRMKAVVDNGQPLVIYPAGLMCEDGLSTPIPRATYKFLKWLGVDVYVARTSGTYFAMPKWTHGFRPGRTYMDIYRLFTAEQVRTLSAEEIREQAEAALLFDAYREQEQLKVRYADNDNLEGLEQVLYMCPHCGSEFTMQVHERSTIRCTSCGYEERSDPYAMLHNHKGLGQELRYVSDWSSMILERTRERLRAKREFRLASATKILMLDYQKHKFVEVGSGTLSLTHEQFELDGEVSGKPLALTLSSTQFPTLPFVPGKYLELQSGDEIYRCVLADGRLVMKFINLLKANHALREQELACAAKR